MSAVTSQCEGGKDEIGAVPETRKSEQSVWPEDQQRRWALSSVYDLLFYSYISPLLAKGSQQKRDGVRLCEEDLLKVPASMKSEQLSFEFWQFFHGPESKQKVGSTLWQMVKHIYIPAGIYHLITVFCQSCNPLIVRALLSVLEQHPQQQVVKEGLPFAVGVFLVLFVNGLANHRYRYLAVKSGAMMRNTLVNVIYEHVLHLTPRGRSGLTSGEISTLVAVDTQKLFEVAQEGHLIWSLPLSLSLITLFLLLVMGPITLVGIAVLVAFLPLGSSASNKMLIIRKKRIKKTDERIALVSAMLQGIKVAKLNNYEASYLEKITQAREEELALLRREIVVWASTLTMRVASPLLATTATFSVYALASQDHVLTASETFSVLLLFNALRFPISYSARLLGKAAQATSALERISFFLNRDAQYQSIDSNWISTSTGTADPQVAALTLQTASFQQGCVLISDRNVEQPKRMSSTVFRVSEFDFSVQKGEILAVCGPVGSGKSTFVSGIISEVAPACEETKVFVRGKVSYVPQIPFVLNATFRENILFGLPFDRDRYERVVDCCCLRADIEQLGESGDLTQIGERGVTLSGGQKQRISLARAAYSNPDLILLDDPLSALDSSTSRLVFDRLIQGDNAYFENTAVVLVTHASHFLSMVDRILVIVEGENKFLGSWSELVKYEPADDFTRKAVDHLKASVQEDIEGSDQENYVNEIEQFESVVERKENKIMTIEEREAGLSSLKTWLLWFRYAGGSFFLFISLFILAVDRLLYVGVEYWIARWTSGAEEPINVFGKTFPPQADGRSAQYEYLKVLASLVLASIIATNCRSSWIVRGGSRAATEVSAAMLQRVIKAPMNYFETTPMGRILNRFTFDIEVIDVILTEAMSLLMMAFSWFTASVVVTVAILPYMAVVFVPVVICYFMILLHYRKSAVDLQRLDALSRSPIQAMVTEVLDGSSSIRVFNVQENFVKKFRMAADTNTSALLNYNSAQRWLGVRIESLGATVVLASASLAVGLNEAHGIDPGIVGLLVVWSSTFTLFLSFLIDYFNESEAAITAIERVDAMTRIPIEKPMETEEGVVPPPEWPPSGEIKFENVCLRYRPDLPLALDNLSFTLPAGKRCGVVGRTGAGKSSLTVALFRLVEIESGRILLDGHDLGQLGLSDVRGRPHGMGIIPQDPFLTGANLRSVLDPFRRHSDTDVLDALRAVRMARASDSTSLLDTAVEEGGSNFSYGERQLLNLAHAFLSKPRVLVLDEATAGVDGETDAFIQQMLRTQFKDTTLLTIAHRLNTVMDYDIILVMANGRAAEIGSPSELLQSNGLFADLVDSTGPESAKVLRMLADKAVAKQ